MDATFGGVHFIVDSGGFLRLSSSGTPGPLRTSAPKIIVPQIAAAGLSYSFDNNNVNIRRNIGSTGSGQEHRKRRRDLDYELRVIPMVKDVAACN
jgi:hypothetical protein